MKMLDLYFSISQDYIVAVGGGGGSGAQGLFECNRILSDISITNTYFLMQLGRQRSSSVIRELEWDSGVTKSEKVWTFSQDMRAVIIIFIVLAFFVTPVGGPKHWNDLLEQKSDRILQASEEKEVKSIKT